MFASWPEIRAQYPALLHCTYLNTATYGQLSIRAQQATMEHYKRRDRGACSDFLSWFDDMDQLRVDVAKLINAPSGDDIAFFPNAAMVLSLLMGGIKWRAGDQVLTLEREFPNNLYLPALLAKHGVELVECKWPDFWTAIGPRTRLVALSTVNWATGLRPPLAEIKARLPNEALLYLDATQSCGALRLDVESRKPDVVAVDAYKWLCAPNGAGFGYFTPEVRQWLSPSVIGWRSHKGWRAVEALHSGAPEFPDGAERYEGGMIPFPCLYAMRECVRSLFEIGPEVVEQRILELADACRKTLAGLGAQFLGDGKRDFNSQIIAARFEGLDSALLARMLKDREIHVSARYGWLRVSVHFYNNEEDLSHLGVVLQELLSSNVVRAS